MQLRIFFQHILAWFLLLSSGMTLATLADMSRLQKAYPDYIQKATEDSIIWADGTEMMAGGTPSDCAAAVNGDNVSLIDQIANVFYEKGIPPEADDYRPSGDPGRVRYDVFFRKMYGDSHTAVVSKLVKIYWMPKFFKEHYPLFVTSINHVDAKLIHISCELEALLEKHPDYLPFLDNPGGAFEWRVIANTKHLSNHSFGIAIDMNAEHSEYWQADLYQAGQAISEDAVVTYHNSIPWEIVSIFEKYGFIWGGKWYHYDTMHFEYRPELMIQ